jgi:beta-lactamase regulating signal transducer with metallopeptidase domain
MSFAFLVQMGWKSALIAGAALVILRLLRSRSAADRAAMLQLAVLLLLLLPAISVALPSLQVVPPAPLAAVEAAPPLAAPTAEAPLAAASVADALPARRGLSLAAALTLAYAAGTVLLLGRMAAGLTTLARWTRQARPVAAPEWTTALARVRPAAGVRGRVRLLASDHVPSPLSWGLARPVILIDVASLARSEDADAILAHELAHVARRDWLVLMASRLAAILFWFHPLVWRLERALVQAAEEAADRRAIERVEPVSYASTLVACVRPARAGVRALPANGMAPRLAMKARVEAILDPERRGRASGSLVTAGAMGLCVVLAGPVAALELVPPAPLTPPAAAAVRLAAAEASIPAAPPQPVRPAHAATPAKAERPDRIEVAPPPEPERADEAETAMTEIRIPEVRVPEIRIPEIRIPEIRVQVPDVGPAVAAAAARRGRGPSAEEIFGITPGRRRAYAELGYRDLTRDQLVAMAVHGVSPGYIQSMAQAGYPGLTPDQLVEMRIFGVTPGLARRAAQAHGRPSPDDLIEMKLFGVL